MNLSPQAQQTMDELIKLTAQAYGSRPGQAYAATPSVAQSLMEKVVVDGGWFWQLIRSIPVSEITGEKVGLSLTGSVASRTDTSGAGERSAKNLADTAADPYQLYKTDFDVAIRYALIDAWAKFSNFREMYQQIVRKAIANDRLKIGWRGTSAAADSVAADLSDVNIGWLHQIRNYNGGAQYVDGQGGTAVQLGSATYPNLDTLVYEIANSIEEPFQDDPDLVVMVGRSVIQAAKGSYYEANGNTPTEKSKLHERMTFDTYGGLPAYYPPFFDANTILVTSFDNLNLYYQDSSVRREQVNNPKKDQYEEYLSDNEGYVVEELGKTSLVDNIGYA